MKKYGIAPVEKIVCDRCGQESDASQASEYSTFTCKTYGRFGDYDRNEWSTEKFDICSMCAEDVKGLIFNYRNNSTDKDQK